MLFAIAARLGVRLILVPTDTWLFPIFAGLSLLFGVLLIIPIGGADMPTVIALLNSYAGLSACAMGFALDNKLLIIAGALDGSSGLILSIIMCKAMNRSFTNVLFGAFGQIQAAQAVQRAASRTAAPAPKRPPSILEAAGSVIIVPGYGMAVAQAQHKIRELFDNLTRRGVDVKFAIHPVAGRMPGHMNVLLAEADIPYDRLVEMDDINSEFRAVRRGARDRRQRRHQPRRAPRQVEPDLRHADPGRRQGAHRDGDQALDEPRLRRHRQRAVLHGPDADALRRRQGVRGEILKELPARVNA